MAKKKLYDLSSNSDGFYHFLQQISLPTEFLIEAKKTSKKKEKVVENKKATLKFRQVIILTDKFKFFITCMLKYEIIWTFKFILKLQGKLILYPDNFKLRFSLNI